MKKYLKQIGKISMASLIALIVFTIYHRVTINRYKLQQRLQKTLIDQEVAENVETKNNDSSPRVFCLILTRPSPDVMKLEAVTNAWAKYCDGHVFVAKLAPDVNKRVLKRKFPILQPDGILNDTYNALSTKVFNSFRDVYIKHKGYDWYLKADDDTFIFVDNLKRFLKDKNPTEATTFGHFFNIYGGYHSGGAGYLLSSEALRRFGEQLVVDQSYCSNSGTEDIDIAKCLRKLNIQMDKNPKSPITYGYTFNVIVTVGYHSGGGGYVLSNEALRRLSEQLLVDDTYCQNTGIDDLGVARCLRKLEVYPGVSVDEVGPDCFHPLSLYHHLTGSYPDWLVKRANGSLKKGVELVSDTTISFHYMSKTDIQRIGNAYEKYLVMKRYGAPVPALSLLLSKS